MRRFVSPQGEESVKAKKLSVIKIAQSVKYLIYASILCAVILALLFFQFRRNFHELQKVLRNSRKFRRVYPVMIPNSIKGRIITPKTQVVFTESRLAEISICIKVWQRQHIKEDVATQILYLLKGFIYNQLWAPRVYLFIVYLEGFSEDTQTFQHGHITIVPRKSKLAYGEYAYVMKALQIDWRLDHRLDSEKEPLATNEGMKFLAREVARLHRKARPSPSKRGLPTSIEKKLNFNMMRFEQALEKLSQDGSDVGAYQWINQLMKRAGIALDQDFWQRHNQGHIKRCHGDLKLTNLWIRPASAKYPKQQLLAIDCIDFNPDFCHIDTLSDVAMLAMDLQMHLLNGPQNSKCEELVEVFIATYLQEMKEHRESINALLQYYITEKTIVCAYVSILLDNDPERGRKYLSLSYQHAQRLQTLLSLPERLAVNAEEEEVANTVGLANIH